MSNHYLAALDALAYSRPHLDPANYAGAYAAYRADQRGNVQALTDYRTIRAHIAPSAEALADLARGSRIEFVQRIGTVKDRIAEREPGMIAFNALHVDGEPLIVEAGYCAGQYYPVEYRLACVRLLATLWRRIPAGYGYSADEIRAHARNVFGLGIARRWFS